MIGFSTEDIIEVKEESKSQEPLDLSYVIVAVASNGLAYILDYSSGFDEVGIKELGACLDDNTIVSTAESLLPNSLYKLTNFRSWESRDWESGLPDDWGFEAKTATLMYSFPEKK